MEYLIPYLILINAAGLALMLADKRRAVKNRWRVPEATLMTVAAAGGSFGVLLGMYAVRHKTRKPKFSVGVPLLLMLHTAIALWILSLPTK